MRVVVRSHDGVQSYKNSIIGGVTVRHQLDAKPELLFHQGLMDLTSHDLA